MEFSNIMYSKVLLLCSIYFCIYTEHSAEAVFSILFHFCCILPEFYTVDYGNFYRYLIILKKLKEGLFVGFPYNTPRMQNKLYRESASYRNKDLLIQ